MAQPAIGATKAKKTTKKAITKATTAPTTAAPITTPATAAPTTAPAPTSDVDPNGVLRIGTSLTANTRTVQWDPLRMTAPTIEMHTLVYETLLRQGVDGKYSPGLAKSAVVDGEKSISVELFPNLKFSDGTPLDSTAVKFGIERNFKNFTPAAFRTDLLAYDDTIITSPTKFTIKLKTPVAGYWYQFLAAGETAPVSPTAANAGTLATKPIGAGPFMMESLVPESKIRLVKSPTYHNAAAIRLAAIEYIHVADPTAAANALLSGAIDALDNASIVTERAVRGKSNFQLRTEKSDDLRAMVFLCKRDGPLADQRVRRALSLAADREALNRIIYEGKSEVMDSLVASNSPLYERKNKDFNKRNVDQAKKLLADAGYPNGFRLDFFYSVGDSQSATEVLQQNWKDIGVNLDIALSNNTTADFFTANPRRAGLYSAVPRVGVDIATRTMQGPSVGNTCGYNDEELNRVVDLAKSVSPDSAEYRRYWSLFNDVVMEKTVHLFLTFGIYRNIWSDKVAGQTFTVDSGGIPSIDARTTYKKR